MDEGEDDNDFLGGVIEFGDGTQYTIKVNDNASAPNGVVAEQEPDVPVSKEERFADDFDRSWPKSSAPVASHDEVSSQRRSSSDTSSNVSHSPVSMRDPSQPRVLFNERLNKMEPASMRSDKRDPPDLRGRLVEKPDNTSAGSRSRVLLLQKAQQSGSAHTDESSHPSRHAAESRRDDALESGSTISQSSDGMNDTRRAWGPRAGLHSRPNIPESKWVNGRRDPSNSRDTSSVTSSLSNADAGRSAWGGRSGPQINDARHLRTTGREGERQLPPHLQRSLIDAWKESPWSKRPSEPAHPEPAHPEPVHSEPEPVARRSSVIEAKVEAVEPPHSAADNSQKQDEVKPPVEVPDLSEIQKAVLQDSAERAKRRRQQEEEERLKAHERARKKAAELEAHLLASGSVATSQKPEQHGAEPVQSRPSEVSTVK